MSVVLAMLAPAATFSVAAVVALAAIPHAPPRIRENIAFFGLGAWIVPWPWLEIPVDMPGSATFDAWIGAPLMRVAPVQGSLNGFDVSEYWPAALVVLIVPGLLKLVAEGWIHRRTLLEWRARSGGGDALRGLLPTDLQTLRAEIRVLPSTRVAAASGWRSPTVWIGDGLQGEDLRVALLHEFTHLRRRDPLRIAAVTAVRLAYWWNPLVAYLARQASIAIEMACDRECALRIGRRVYVERLAVMLLDAESEPAPRLAAAVRTSSFNVLRLELLSGDVRLRASDAVLLAMLTTAGATAAAAQLTEPTAKPEWSRVTIPATPAGEALIALIEGFNDRDVDWLQAYLGAYTPQEVALSWSDWPPGGELVDIVRSEPLSIEYVVRDPAGEPRYGRVSVGDSPLRIIDAEFRDVSSVDVGREPPKRGKRGFDE